MIKRPTTVLGWVAWIIGGSFVLLCGCLALGFGIGAMGVQRQEAAQQTAPAQPTPETIQPTEADRATEEPTARPTNAPLATAEAREAVLPGYVSRETMGDDWPLSIDEGILTCTDKREVILIASSGTYAVNGTARTVMEARRWKDIRDITLPGAVEGLTKDVGPLLDVGLALCN